MTTQPTKQVFQKLMPMDQERVRSMASNMLTRRILNKEVDPADDTAMQVALESCVRIAITTLAAVDEKLCG